MPVTDMAWGPDGAMYLVTGGRGTQSGLYRIRAVDAASAATANEPPAHESQASSTAARRGARTGGLPESVKAARAERRRLESWQRPLSPAEFGAAYPAITAALESDDRTLAFAARVALEHQPASSWRARVVELPTERARLTAALALARRGNDDDARTACATAAAALKTAGGPSARGADVGAGPAPDAELLILALRTAQVALLRRPEIATTRMLVDCGDAAVTLGADMEIDPRVAQAALELACALRLPGAIAPCLERLDAAVDRADALRWATMVRMLEEGWTEPLRERYWRWLDAADAVAGGMSLGGFIEAIRNDATTHVRRPQSSPERAPREIAIQAAPPSTTARVVHAWTVADLLEDSDRAVPSGGSENTVDAPPSNAATSGTDIRDLARGARIYREASCILCHRFAGDGAATGPDLTGVGSRFGRADLLRAILEPNAAVSDQYRDSLVTTVEGDVFVGRIVADAPEFIEIRTNPMGFERERIERAKIASIELLETSSMPPGLLDARSRDEILDLLEYLESGGGKR